MRLHSIFLWVGMAMLTFAFPVERANASPQGPVVEVRLDKETDETLLSIRADNAPFRELMGVIRFELSAVTGRDIELVGLDKLARNPRVSAYLIDRSWRESLRWIAGSAGVGITLTSSRIEIAELIPNFANAGELRMRALLAYRQILGEHPEMKDADVLYIESGKLATELGPDFYTTALESYETLLEDKAQSPLVSEAMYRSAQVYGLMGEWEKAAVRFHEVADSSVPHEFHVDARKSLANALCELGERDSNPLAREDHGNKAVLTLEAVDRYYPSENREELRKRAIMMARALTLTSDPVQALRALDVAAERSIEGFHDAEILTVRAKALSRAGQHGASSTAWLAVSSKSAGKELENALQMAAEEALAGGHELAVLAIHSRAIEQGFGRKIEAASLEAKLRLGIATEVEGFTLNQRLTRALQLEKTGQNREAASALRPIYIRRAELIPARRLDMALGMARSLHAEKLGKEAIETLRVIAGESTSAMDKRQIYTLAAQLHESDGDFEAAIEALKGNL